VGPRRIAQWVDRAGSAGKAWRHLPVFLDKGADREEILAAWRGANPAGVIAEARGKGMAVYTLEDPAYPAALRTIDDRPPVVFVRGALDTSPAVAVIGSRRATAYGLAAAARLAADLASAGVTIVSGLARGIDGAAHQAALDAGGRTIAVLGCGGDVIYPPEHGALAGAVAAAGALVTEFAPGTPPMRGHFPRRNRIISGLSRGVVVVEGTEDSGALVTVDYALGQGREVFAVPGSIFSRRSRAPHVLLREGAHVVERAEDVLHVLKLPLASGAPAADRGAAEAAWLLALLDEGPRSSDELVAACGRPAGEVAAALSMLEIRGLIRTLPGQMVMRTPQGRRTE
jgi:DNA processing protein